MIPYLIPNGTMKDVLIVGAGLAGLTAAYELYRAGHQVTILEAKDRPGGRVCTLRDCFADGLYAEAGAEYFYPTDPDYAMAYIRHFGLEIVPLEFTRAAAIVQLRGRRIRYLPNEKTDWPLTLTPEEKQLGLNGMQQRFVQEPHSALFRTPAKDWTPEILQPYDSKSFADIMMEAGASADCGELLRLMDFDFVGEGERKTSALELLGDRAKFSQFQRPFYAIKGGNGVLPARFAQELSPYIHYGNAVTDIEQSGKTVRITCIQAKIPRTFTADYLVLAIPFSVLRHLQIYPPFSQEKQQVIQTLPYSSVCRVYLQSRQKFWKDDALSGLGITDLPVTYVWESTWSQPGPRGILQAYATGPTARQMAIMQEKDRIDFALQHTAQVHPRIVEMAEGTASKSWDSDPWALGGYSLYTPGILSRISHIACPAGRIHFAGEHTTTLNLHATIQGAIQSGLRVAVEIHEAR